MDKYKELSMRLSLRNTKEWAKAINTLKTLEFDNKKKEYTVIYKKENQRKNREFEFHKAEYVEKAYTFIFTSFSPSDEDGSLTDEVYSREVLLEVEIVDLKIEEKNDMSFVL
ncbi:hypothetical protein K2F43_05980 [Clostridium estertheticum]|uniref:hypothetical protein n=1 Tax=Clostridium estertheticum TaxID=238834 RepID=UPI001C6ECDDE|nr:hypothetical protein [Clostridium estertheticum]MBW9170754.1 hypothetical protein [Clostridium estertheticum]WLC74406.1 hypothetical protein KTC99_16770 [Clostridium estertheticum]